jgi:hypothetical protein
MNNSMLINKGYCKLKNPLSASVLQQVEKSFTQLASQGVNILQDIAGQDLSYAEYYQQGKASFITVPEADNPTQTCRFEYINATSDFMREVLIPLCANEIQKEIGQPVSLFKINVI